MNRYFQCALCFAEQVADASRAILALLSLFMPLPLHAQSNDITQFGSRNLLPPSADLSLIDSKGKPVGKLILNYGSTHNALMYVNNRWVIVPLDITSLKNQTFSLQNSAVIFFTSKNCSGQGYVPDDGAPLYGAVGLVPPIKNEALLFYRTGGGTVSQGVYSFAEINETTCRSFEYELSGKWTPVDFVTVKSLGLAPPFTIRPPAIK